MARVKQQNGGRVMAKQDDLRHEGVHAQRVRSDHNKLEAVQRDAAVAATVVQWMGSPIGQAFMDECREEAEGQRR